MGQSKYRIRGQQVAIHNRTKSNEPQHDIHERPFQNCAKKIMSKHLFITSPDTTF